MYEKILIEFLVDRDMLTRVWNDLDYLLDDCRISQGGYIEHS